MDHFPVVAFTEFAYVWPRATETEIGANLCAIGAILCCTRELKNLEKKSVHVETSNEGNFTTLFSKMFFA